MTVHISSRAVKLLSVAIVGILSLGVLLAAHQPADKTAVSASESEEEFIEDGASATLLTETLRVSNPTDLILGVTAECSILSEIATQGNDMARTEGQLTLHVTVDGEHVPVSDADEDDGRVVFCNRVYERETTLFDDEDARIEDFLATRQANAFNWVALDAGELDSDGDGLLDVVVTAEYEEDNTSGENGDADSEGVVGNRTLVIEPTKAKNDETRSAD